MNGETAQNPFPTSADNPGMSSGTSMGGADGSDTNVHRFAQKVHEAVDTLEQKLGQSSDRVMSMQQEYGDMAREQVRMHPLASVGIAFAAGYVFAKVFSR